MKTESCSKSRGKKMIKNLKFLIKVIAFIFFVIAVIILNKISSKFTYAIGWLLGLEEA